METRHFSSILKNEYAWQGILVQGISVFLLGYIFFIAIPHTTAIQEICFYVPLALTFMLIAARRIAFNLDTPLSVPFLLFACWAIIDLYFALDKRNSIHDIYAHLFKYLAFYFMVVNFFDSTRKLSLLIRTIIASSVVLSLGSIVYFYVFKGATISGQLGYNFPETSPNILSLMLLPAVILSLNCTLQSGTWGRKILFMVAFFITMISLFLTQTRSTFLGLILAVCILLLKDVKKLLIVILGILVIAGIMPGKDRFSVSSIIDKILHTDRIKIGLAFIEIVKDYPVTGIGFGMQTYYDDKMLEKYNSRLPRQFRQEVPHKAPHNILIDVAVRLGLTGLALFLYIWFSFIRMGFMLAGKGRTDFVRNWGLCFFSIFIAILIPSMVENTSSGPPAVLMYTVFAMMTITYRLDRRQIRIEKSGIMLCEPGK